MRVNKFWLGVTIVVTLAVGMWVFAQCAFEIERVQAAPTPAEVEVVAELKPINKKFDVVRVEWTERQTNPTAARIITKSRSEVAGTCVVYGGENVACMYQRVDWSWRYNTDKHQASWVAVDWDKWHWRDNALANFWYFKSWDGTSTTHGEKPSAGENLQWKERKIWATFEYCVLSVGCLRTEQMDVRQHIENYDDGGYFSVR